MCEALPAARPLPALAMAAPEPDPDEMILELGPAVVRAVTTPWTPDMAALILKKTKCTVTAWPLNKAKDTWCVMAVGTGNKHELALRAAQSMLMGRYGRDREAAAKRRGESPRRGPPEQREKDSRSCRRRWERKTHRDQGAQTEPADQPADPALPPPPPPPKRGPFVQKNTNAGLQLDFVV